MKKEMSEMENTLEAINSSIDIVEEKWMNLKAQLQKLSQTKHVEQGESRKTKRASVSCGTTSNSIINIKLEYPRERRMKKKLKKKNG